MKTINTLILLVIFISGCNKEDTPTSVTPLQGYGKIGLLDEVGNFQSNKANIKVTILESQQTSYTDSAGVYSFSNLASRGPHTIVFEFKDYPSITLINYFFSSSKESAINSHLVEWDVSMSPIAQYKLSIKVVQLWDTSKIAFTVSSVSSKPSYSMYYLVLFDKQAAIDYKTHDYLSIVGVRSVTTPSMQTLHGSDDTWSAENLYDYGFKKGDSMYVRIYPVTSFYRYKSSITATFIYPSIGEGSNIVGIKVP